MDDTAKSIRRTFAIAHNWRDSQGYPMNRFRGILNVQIKKNYVSFHFMPIYIDPTLRESLSPALRKRMQGKGCFNFSTIEPADARGVRDA